MKEKRRKGGTERERERERERAHTHMGEGQRERILSRLLAVSAKPDIGFNPSTMRSLPELKSRVKCLTD